MATAKHIVVAEEAWRGYQKVPMKLRTPQATSETDHQYPIADGELQQAWARTAIAEISLPVDLRMLSQLSHRAVPASALSLTIVPPGG